MCQVSFQACKVLEVELSIRKMTGWFEKYLGHFRWCY